MYYYTMTFTHFITYIIYTMTFIHISDTFNFNHFQDSSLFLKEKSLVDWFFEMLSPCVTLTGLEFNENTRLASTLQQIPCLWSPGAGSRSAGPPDLSCASLSTMGRPSLHHRTITGVNYSLERVNIAPVFAHWFG